MGRRGRTARSGRSQGGSILLETVLAILIMTTVGVALIAMVQKYMVVTLKAREQVSCGRLAQTGFARLKNVDFYYLFATDSDSANHGLWSAYPYKAVLDGIRSTLRASKFDRFRVTIVFMRRDTSDADGDGSTSDLIAFADADGNGADDYDSGIRGFDQNGDGDTYDTYTSGGRTVAEQPDTHIKKVTFDVFRRGRLACSQTEYVSLEQFSGNSNPSSEAVLSLQLSTPTNNAVLYQADTAALAAARALAITQAFPAGLEQFRADAASPMLAAGETDPLAEVDLYVGGSGVLASPAADASGAFSDSPAAVTGALAEGYNEVAAQAVKDGYTSPITRRTVLLDLAPPRTASPAPTGTVNTRAPQVAITLSDPGVSTTVASGICPDVITLKAGGVVVPFQYDATTGQVVWIDSGTNTVPVLADGTYAMTVEGGDYAGYKTTQTWSFTVNVDATDHSAPAIAEKSPIGMADSQLPEISVRVFDNQSGVIPASIRMTLDGEVVVDAANIGSHYDASDGTVSYTPPTAFEAGSVHLVSIQADHFATNPADKVTSADTWGFSVP